MSLRDQLNTDLRDAMRAGDTVRKEAIRFLLAGIKNAEIELGRPLENGEILAVARRQIKQRSELIAEFERARRSDRLAEELAGLAVLDGYLPPQIGSQEIEAAVRAAAERVGATGPQDVGKVMRELTVELKGRADMRQVHKAVRAHLGRQ